MLDLFEIDPKYFVEDVESMKSQVFKKLGTMELNVCLFDSFTPVPKGADIRSYPITTTRYDYISDEDLVKFEKQYDVTVIKRSDSEEKLNRVSHLYFVDPSKVTEANTDLRAFADAAKFDTCGELFTTTKFCLNNIGSHYLASRYGLYNMRCNVRLYVTMGYHKIAIDYFKPILTTGERSNGISFGDFAKYYFATYDTESSTVELGNYKHEEEGPFALRFAQFTVASDYEMEPQDGRSFKADEFAFVFGKPIETSDHRFEYLFKVDNQKISVTMFKIQKFTTTPYKKPLWKKVVDLF